MGSIVGVVQGYSNTIQQYDSQASINQTNEARTQAVKSLDMNTIAELGPNDPTVAALNESDKKQVISNANNSLKQECLEAWGKDLDKSNKEFAEDFDVFAD